jgi:hypothetical protein
MSVLFNFSKALNSQIKDIKQLIPAAIAEIPAIGGYRYIINNCEKNYSAQNIISL